MSMVKASLEQNVCMKERGQLVDTRTKFKSIKSDLMLKLEEFFF